MLGAKDVHVKQFVYRRCPTVASTLWAAWRLMPRLLRLKVYQCLMYFGQATSSTRVTCLPFGLYAKHGCNTSVTEALATQYVSANTTIPVPTILDVLLDSFGTPLILMTRVPGTPLGDMPLTANELSDAQLSTFTSTMARWLTQLRQLGPPPSGQAVCGFMGTPFMSYRIDHSGCVGPFSSSDEFHSQYCCTLPPKPIRIFAPSPSVSERSRIVSASRMVTSPRATFWSTRTTSPWVWSTGAARHGCRSTGS
ncbi:hypothetical protein V8D89_001935 [Ganoderma adspersum]